jgi:proline dehydrogenase
MLRPFFISLSRAQWAQRAITHWGLAWRMASRFIAGETRAEAIEVVRRLNGQGILATLDHLGENTGSLAAASQAAAEVIEILADIDHQQVKANISIKLSQIGLTLDEGVCRENLCRILEAARRLGTFVRIDMEDSSLTEATLGSVLRAHEQGFANVGVVVQAYLRRSEVDIRRLRAVPVPVRLCKGAYQEPDRIAFPDKKDVDAAYDRLGEMLMEGALAIGAPSGSPDGLIPPLVALATHDERRIQAGLAAIERLKLPPQAVEFQMLYGIRRDLQLKLARSGNPVRVYVPYGTRWYPYFMRRLAERPANLWFFLSNFFRK